MAIKLGPRVLNVSVAVLFLCLSSNAYSQWVRCGNCHGMPPQYRNACVLLFGADWDIVDDMYSPLISGTYGAPGGIDFGGCPVTVPYEFHSMNIISKEGTFTRSGSMGNGTLTITVKVVDYSGIFSMFNSAVKQAWQKNFSGCGVDIDIVVNLQKQLFVSPKYQYHSRTSYPTSWHQCNARKLRKSHDKVRRRRSFDQINPFNWNMY